MGRLHGKVALITGTGSGQGRTAARLFAAEGAIVVGCDLDQDGAAETVEMVRSSGGTMSSTHPLDLGDEASVQAWIDAAADAHGGIDILYNNAAATRFSPLTETSYEDWSFTLRNELDIVFLATKHAWPHLIARGGGSVLLVGSTAGITGSVTNHRIAHTAGKGGIVAMTRQLAAEGAAHGIRVNCVSPGMIETPASTRTLLAEDHPMRTIARAIPLGRIGTPDEVARCALFLLSEESSYVTGANLVVDGGWSTVLPGAN
ncbi:NAD(P)-dependent dehydrogenase (short-subunit alcohol dehydrogenase family) [Actinocorallia herbida]|uniref:NAD(P)-dependent dehydrogenase (Short-subunit alcohol dehydrogenase family) n=1 Tax=Actinocorallia herbida TaxID=58109 RepID=A0A3N1D4P3_9ACTN|nr:SDR family NAD(P)-dependent oxidoreductase [Actinocorallia herbida]ROO88058.1 NAD(P)-dependent dehydrogenase (short-subunit alcohol dehydrogenase family) [Actinocorallia herbida]